MARLLDADLREVIYKDMPVVRLDASSIVEGFEHQMRMRCRRLPFQQVGFPFAVADDRRLSQQFAPLAGFHAAIQAKDYGL